MLRRPQEHRKRILESSTRLPVSHAESIFAEALTSMGKIQLLKEF